MGTKEAKAVKGAAVGVIFETYSNGVTTNRDAWVYNFNRNVLTENMSRLIENYNMEVARWGQWAERNVNLDDFVNSDETKIKWSLTLKQKLRSGQIAAFAEAKIRQSLYRPFTKSNLYFDRMTNDRLLVFPSIFPTLETEAENQVIVVSDHGFRAGFNTLMANLVPDSHILAARDRFQCFPFLHLRRGRHKPPRKHHRLGIGTLPQALSRRHHHQVGHLPLQLWTLASSRLS